MPAVIPMPVPTEADLVTCQYAQNVLRGDLQERMYFALSVPRAGAR